MIDDAGIVAPELPHASEKGPNSVSDDTPIFQLYRRHSELMDAAETYKSGDVTITDEEMGRLFHDERCAIEVKMIAMPYQTMGGFVPKAIICTSRRRVFPDWETGEVWVEARKLVGEVDG